MIEDLSAFLGEFSVEVTTPSRQTFSAIYEDDAVAVGDVAVDSTAPSLTCRTCDVEAAAVVTGIVVTVQDEVTLYGSFTVRRLTTDNPGVTVLRLERA